MKLEGKRTSSAEYEKYAGKGKVKIKCGCASNSCLALALASRKASGETPATPEHELEVVQGNVFVRRGLISE